MTVRSPKGACNAKDGLCKLAYNRTSSFFYLERNLVERKKAKHLKIINFLLHFGLLWYII